MALADEIRQLALRVAHIEASRQAKAGAAKRPEIERNQKAESRIAKAIDETFSEQELSELAYQLGVDYEAILGEGKRGKVRGFVGHFARRGFLDLLVNQLATERPHFDWHLALLDTAELKA